MSKKHYGFQALFEAEQKKLKAEQEKDQSTLGNHQPYFVTHQLPTSYPPKPDLADNKPTAKPRTKDRHSKEKAQLGIRQSVAIVQRAKEFCVKHNILLQDLYELAVTQYLDLVGNHQNKHVGSLLPHDDLMIFKTHDDIIMLYKQYSGREKWTAKDDRAAEPFNNTDRRLIEIGMIHTVANAKGKKIHSFAYFIPEIQTMLDLRVEKGMLDGYLRTRRERLAKIMQDRKKGVQKAASPAPAQAPQYSREQLTLLYGQIADQIKKDRAAEPGYSKDEFEREVRVMVLENNLPYDYTVLMEIVNRHR